MGSRQPEALALLQAFVVENGGNGHGGYAIFGKLQPLFACGCAAYGTLWCVALVNAARLFGKTAANVLGVVNQFAEMTQHFFLGAHHVRLSGLWCSASRARAAGNIQARGGYPAFYLVAIAYRARQQASLTLRIVILARSEPAFKHMAGFTLQIEYFQGHDLIVSDPPC